MSRRKVVVKANNRKLPTVVYGLSGIMELFNVCKSTAFKYRHGILKDACVQHDKVIVVDVRMALKLFGHENPEKLMNKSRETYKIDVEPLNNSSDEEVVSCV